MSTLTPRMKLIRNDGQDPFKRQDFIDNWNKIDAAPGVHICTSTSRPTWGQAEAGRQIQETDTKRQVLWTGTSWQDPLNVPPAWFLSVDIDKELSKGVDRTFTIGTFTTSRPLNSTIIMNVRVGAMPRQAQYLRGYIYIDDKQRTLSTGWVDQVQWPNAQLDSDARDWRILNMFAPANVDPGTHKVELRCKVGNLSSQPVLVAAMSCVILGTNTSGR